MATGLLGLGTTPEQQAQKNQTVGGLFALGQQKTTQLQNQGALNYNAAPAMPGSFDATRQAATDKVGGYLTGRLNEQYAQRDDDQAQAMANRGIDSGNQAYQREMQQYNDQKARDYETARMTAFTAGADEQKMGFDQGMQLRQQGVGEANALHQQGYQDLNSILNPGTALSGQQSAENIAGAQTQGELDIAQKQYDADAYGADRQYDASKYDADRGYDQTRYSSDRGYDSTRYTADKGLEAANKNDKIIQALLQSLGITVPR